MSSKISEKDLDPTVVEKLNSSKGEIPTGLVKKVNDKTPDGEGTVSLAPEDVEAVSVYGGKLGGDYFFDGTIERVLGFKGPNGMNHGFFFNPTGMGIYDWINERNVFNYNSVQNVIDITTSLLRINGKNTSVEGHKHAIADVTGLAEALANPVTVPNASTTVAGKVMLSNTIDLDNTKAITPRAINALKNDIIAELGFKANSTLGSPTNLTLLNGWQHNYPMPLVYYKDGFGLVHLEGSVFGGNTNINTIMATLPVGYRPRQMVGLSGINGSSGGVGAIVLNTEGNVYVSVSPQASYNINIVYRPS